MYMHSFNMNAVQWDAYHPLVDCIRHALWLGVYLPGGVPAQGGVPDQEGGVPARECTCPVGFTCPGTPPVDRQTPVKT